MSYNIYGSIFIQQIRKFERSVGFSREIMKKVSVLIVSCDADYSSNVAGYFRNHYSESALVVFCSVPSNIPEYIINNRISIILADSDLYEQAVKEAGGRCAVYKLVESKADADERSVAKYISAPLLYNEILFIYAKMANEDSSDESIKGNIYSFISVNGCGATALSVSFAHRLATAGKKVLFIGLDGLSDYKSIFSSASERGLSEIILALKSKSASVSVTARSVVNQGEVSFIDKCRCFDDIYEIDDSETTQLFDKTISCDAYDAVVLDISPAFLNVWNYAAKRSRFIFCVTMNRTSSIAKTNNFIETVKVRDFRNSTDAFSRLRVLVNRTSSTEPTADIACENIGFIQRYSAENYDELTSKIASDSVWDEYVKR